MKRIPASIALFAALFALIPAINAQQKPPRVWTAEEQPIVDGIRSLRKQPDDQRGAITRDLALKIRALKPSIDKRDLAVGLAHLSTEGDFGRDNLQEVTTTLAEALKETPVSREKDGRPAEPYVELASLVRYEHMKASSDDPQYTDALKQLEAHDAKLQTADFTLKDTTDKQWNLKSLKGKVVLVNFWATWCPPCRKEMPDLDALQKEFADQGLVVLGITDEEPKVVDEFLAKHHYNYAIVYDPGRVANATFGVEGIPKTFIYDRDGKLVAQSIDMRTMAQFKAMLAEAGLK